MSIERPKSRLRTYLLAYFIPLAGVPLFALAVLFYVIVGRVFSEEITRRAAPELAAVDRNLDTIERKLVRETQMLSRSEELVHALKRRDRENLLPVLSTWVHGSHFESVKVFDDRGHLLSESENAAHGRVEKNWTEFLGPRPLHNQSGKDDSKRDPASRERPKVGVEFHRNDALFDSENSLYPAFRAFLAREESWVVRRRKSPSSSQQPGRSVWEWSVFKRVLDSEYKPVGFVEAQLVFDPVKLKVLSDYQGVDVVVLDPALNVLSSSNDEIETRFSGLTKNLVDRSGNRDLEGKSVEIEVGKEPVEFFFTPNGEAGSESQVWIGVGLFKGEQMQILRKILTWVSIFVLLMALLVVYLTVRISNWVTKPVSDLVDATEAIRLGQWVHPVEVDENTELGFLVNRFNEMAKSVQITKRMLELKLEELASAHTALTQTQDQLVQSAKLSSLGQLVAGVAHELNNPIAFIYSNMTQMKTHLGQIEKVDTLLGEIKGKLDSPMRAKIESDLESVEWNYVLKDMQDMVQSCLEGSVRVKDIVLGLRNFSRLDKGEIVQIDVNEVIKGTAKLLGGQIKNKVELHWDLCSRAEIECNPSQIHQVFMNLLANAVQAISERGEVWVKTEMRENKRNGTSSLRISVRDNGKGISRENLDKIFDPFFTTKKVGEGTGLGLSIVYGIVERHGGRIEVLSRQSPDPNPGTEFVLQLPTRRITASHDIDDIAS